MIRCESSNIKLLKVNYVGNRIAEEGVRLSGETLHCDELSQSVIGRYLLYGMEYKQFYHLTHDSEVKYNRIFALVDELFSDELRFSQVADEITTLLYQKCNDKNVPGGYLFIVFFKNCEFKGTETDAIGIFKTEKHDLFLKILSDGSDIRIATEQGLALNKMGKGCIIFNIERNDGFRVAVLNKNRTKASGQYWQNDFLGCKPISNEFHQTQIMIKAIGQFISEQEIDDVQKALLKNISVKELTSSETVCVKDIIASVAASPEGQARMQQIINAMVEGNHEMPAVLSPDASAIKKSHMKSSLKLDNNFEIVFHGGEDLIETGVDSVTGMRYIKLLYKSDH